MTQGHSYIKRGVRVVEGPPAPREPFCWTQSSGSATFLFGLGSTWVDFLNSAYEKKSEYTVGRKPDGTFHTLSVFGVLERLGTQVTKSAEI